MRYQWECLIPTPVQEGVVIPVEEAIADLDGIREINSVAAEGMGVVTVRVENGYDVRNVMDDIKTRVDAIDNFAQEAERASIARLVAHLTSHHSAGSQHCRLGRRRRAQPAAGGGGCADRPSGFQAQQAEIQHQESCLVFPLRPSKGNGDHQGATGSGAPLRNRN